MAHTHDLALRGARRDLEHRGDALRFRDQRVIAASLKILSHAAEHALAVVPHRRDFAVHEPRCAHDAPAEHLDQRLMTEAYAEDWNASRECLDHRHRHPRVARPAGPRRDDQMRVPSGERRLDADGVVTVDVDVRAEHPERPHEVIGERIVVVDQQYSRTRAHRPSAAMLSARRSTALFAMSSSYSAFGELSATIPPPA